MNIVVVDFYRYIHRILVYRSRHLIINSWSRSLHFFYVINLLYSCVLYLRQIIEVYFIRVSML